MKLRIALAFAAVPALAVPAGAGEEFFCTTSPTHFAYEAWPDDAPSSNPCSVTWRDLKYEIGMTGLPGAGQTIYLGFPGANCSTYNPTAPPATGVSHLGDILAANPSVAEQIPGVQSIVRAAQRWNDAAESDVSFHFPPTIVFADWQQIDSTITNSTSCTSSAVPVITVAFYDDNWILSAGVLAGTWVSIDSATGRIIDADILLNRAVAWYEENDYHGLPFASAWATSSSGFVDLEGVVTHEFGHVLGLAHSVIDSLHASGANEGTDPLLFPTMFPYAQYTAMPDGSCYAGGCGGDFLAFEDVDQLAYSARTPEADDLATLGRMYPSSTYASTTGAISGTVRRDGVDGGSAGTPLPGANVVAMKAGDVSARKYAVLTTSTGTYRLTGLAPGDYWLYVEPVDYGDPFENPSPFPAWNDGYPTAYFSTADVPQWATTGVSHSCPLNLVATPGSFPMEFWNDDMERFDEARQFAAAEKINVQANVEVTGKDFKVDSDLDFSAAPMDVLTIRQKSVQHLGSFPDEIYSIESSRGARLSFFGDQPYTIDNAAEDTIEYIVRDPTKAGSIYCILIALRPLDAPYSSPASDQLVLAFNPTAEYLPGPNVLLAPLGNLPCVEVVGTLNGNGIGFGVQPVFLSDPAKAFVRYRNICAQALILTPNGSSYDIEVSNPVNLWYIR